jgi:hypothetical protein
MRRGGPGAGWLPTIAVMAVVASTTLGGFVVAAATSEPVGAAVAIPGVVSVQPLSGWEPAGPSSLGDRPAASLTRGSGSLTAVDWGPFASDAAALAVAVRDTLLGEVLDQLTVSDVLTTVTLDGGLEGRRFTFVGITRGTGTAVEGEVTTTLTREETGVVFIGLTHEGLLAFIAGDLHTMVARAVVGVRA